MSRGLCWLLGALLLAALLALGWWGWQQGGLAVQQLGVGVC
ncbi:hypothetical protein [Pseudomonas sp. NW5]|nr:hypothetical protein [Pseudomonas sp. NW5]